jgi:hypothetical protein
LCNRIVASYKCKSCHLKSRGVNNIDRAIGTITASATE